MQNQSTGEQPYHREGKKHLLVSAVAGRATSQQTTQNQPTRQKEDGMKDNATKPVRTIKEQDDTSKTVLGTVDEKQAQYILDSGADITVVPDSLVIEDKPLGDKVKVSGFNGSAVIADTTDVAIEVGSYGVQRESCSFKCRSIR